MTIIVEEHVWIILSDGCRLGARLWLPADAVERPAPAILEYIPYRKRDGTRGRDEPMHGYYAQHGYAAVRVDMRGSGESDGHLADEYLALEQDDALEVIAWIAAQPWCNGAVGMQGKSWGGFNALQVAARRPPALKAIITTFSTDNRYTDDIHFMGGCLLNDNLWWGAIMMAYQARPLDPEIVGPDWRARWIARFETLPFFPALWLEHQRFDDYWKHGSVCTDFDAIVCPVLAIGGWVDSYTNAVPRLLAGLKTPRLGVIGPWGHIYPHDGVPGPAIGFLQEAVRWWDHWLKGRDTGIMGEPMLRAYLQDPVAPEGTRTKTPGRWVGQTPYPSPAVSFQTLRLHPRGALDAADAAPRDLPIRSPQSHGKAAGEWMGAGCPGEHPTDQRLDDGGALVFETAPLAHDLAVLGFPRLTLDLSADAPVAHLVARLCDVHPDGRVARVSYQVLNLTHRDSHERPEPLEPGRLYRVSLDLNVCGHRFLSGHRIRLAIATAYWPMIWPAPYAATLTIRTGESELALPVMADLGAPIDLPPPAHGPKTPMTQVNPGRVRRYSSQDHVTGENTYVTDAVGGVFGEGVIHLDDIDTEIAHSLKRELTIADEDPLSARYLLTQSFDMGREGWRTRIETRTEMTSDADNFYIKCMLNAFDGDLPVYTKTWEQAIKRDLG
jgi:putative CocE/NonD family hydrolase